MQPSDVVRKILSVLPIDKYGHIVTVLHQGDLSIATPTQILGKINAHEIYMHITLQDGSSSTKKKDKDLAFKASQEKGKARIEYESSSDDEVDDASPALMVRRTTKMLKKLNKNGVKFDGKKKKFFTIKAINLRDWLPSIASEEPLLLFIKLDTILVELLKHLGGLPHHESKSCIINVIIT